MSKADTVLLTSVAEEDMERDGDGFRTVRISGDAAASAIVLAVVDNWRRYTGRPEVTDETLTSMIGEKVTLVTTGSNMFGAAMLVAREGKLFAGSRGVSMLPKGARRMGFCVDADKVLDVLPGYAVADATALAESVRANYPQTRRLTQERFEQLPPITEGESKPATLAAFGTWRMPDCDATDAIWLLCEYSKEDDILDGAMLIRPEFGVSEHGSVLGRQLLNLPFGEIVGFQPITFKEVVDLTDLDFDDALAAVMSQLAPA